MTDDVDEHGRKPRTDVVRLKPIPDELTDSQRAKIVQHYRDNPDSGYRAAVRAIGCHGTSAEAKALILGDEEIRRAVFSSLNLGEGSLFKQLGRIATDPEHPKQLEAIRFALKAVWKHSDSDSRTEVDVNHTGSVDNPDVAASIERFTSTVVRLAERGRTEPAALGPGD